MSRMTTAQRDEALRRVGTATLGIAAFAVGATGVATALAWHAGQHPGTSSSTADAGSSQGTVTQRSGGEHESGDDDGGSVSLVPGGTPSQAPTPAPAPGQGSGGGSVGTGGS
jgi:hypothetical protein